MGFQVSGASHQSNLSIALTVATLTTSRTPTANGVGNQWAAKMDEGETMGNGKTDDRHIPVEVDVRPVVKLAESLTDIIQSKDKEIREIKDEHRGVLKEIRESLDTIDIFSSDPLEDHQEACRTINGILEDNGI